MLDSRLIKSLIAEYQQFVTSITFLPRDIAVDSSKCNVFVGLRRAGKSFLMYQCIRNLIDRGVNPDQILFMNFEDDRLPPLELSDLDKIKRCYEEMFPLRPIFFLDELQLVVGWEKFARRLADTGYQVFITGSNAKMLSNEIAGTLGGRYNITEVYPYNFKEYLLSKEITLPSNWTYLPNSNIKREFFDYFHLGGLPEQVYTPKPFRRQWLASLFERIYLGDIVTRHGIRKPQGVKMMIRKLIDSIGQPITVSRLAGIVSDAGEKIKPDTIADYLSFTADAWLTLEFENYAGKLTEKLSVKKYYLIDNGIITLFKDGGDGALLENIVAIHLKKTYRNDVYYYSKNIEIDFYIPDTSEAIQVSYDISNESTLMRELKAFDSLNSHLPLKNCTLITFDEEKTISTPAGLPVNILPVWKYLLQHS